jgi:hypothetical protein
MLLQVAFGEAPVQFLGEPTLFTTGGRFFLWQTLKSESRRL